MKTLKLMALTVLMLCAACTQFDEPVAPNDETPVTRTVINPNILRESAGIANEDNPYGVNSMNKAMIQLCKYYGTRPRPIYATHEYVRFAAKDSLAYYILEDSLDLEIFDHPLDRTLTIAEKEFYMVDVVNGTHWVYTVVPKNFRYPTEIQRQVLQDVFLMGENIITLPTTTSGSSSSTGKPDMSQTEYDEVLTQAMKNANIEIIGGGASATAGVWSPSAHITYEDDLTNETIPLENARVRVNTFLNVGIGQTDKDGNVVITRGWGGRFRNPVDYQIKFKTDKWKIIDNKTGAAQIFGDKSSRQPWNHRITSADHKGSAFAAVHQALQFMYNEQNEITKPTNPVWKMRVAVLWDTNNDEIAGDYRHWSEWLGVAANPIRIWGKSKGKYRDRFRITSTTFHELGHASHAHMTDKYNLAEDKILESYATAVSYYLLSKFYPQNDVADYRFNYNDIYTGIGEALLNQGFTITQIENAVKCVKTWSEFENSIKLLKIIPNELIEYLFANPVHAWDFNLLGESFVHADNTYIAYVNIPAEFVIRPSLFEFSNTQITNWNVIPDSHRLYNTVSTGTDIVFKKKGLYMVSADVAINNGPTYTATRVVKVKDLPTISGSKNSRIGLEKTYNLSDTACFKSWSLSYSDTNGQPQNSDNKIVITECNRNKFKLIFLEPGTYKITANFDYNKIRKSVTFDTSVDSEGSSVGNELTPAIYKVNTYRHNANGSIVHEILNRNFTPTHPECKNLGKEYSFCAFSKKPIPVHPYYNKLKEIWIFDYCNGFYAYSTTPLRADPVNLIVYPYEGLRKVFYVLNEKVPGTIPLYSLNMITKTNDGKDTVLSECRYLSLKSYYNGSFVPFEDNLRSYVTNYGIVGYVYPVE